MLIMNLLYVECSSNNNDIIMNRDDVFNITQALITPHNPIV